MSLNLPIEFKEKYQRLLGDTRYNKLEKSLLGAPVEGFRINPLKENFKEVNIDLTNPIPYSNIGFYGNIDGNSIDHLSGYLYSQDVSAMYVTEVLDPQPGEVVLDLCAAPGSKSTYIASKMKNDGILVANEINTGRAKILSSNIERMGITNTIVTNNRPDQLVDSFKSSFDKIVVDAPCSGEGMFRKDHEAVNYWSNDYVQQCAIRQREILKSAYELLKPNGELVYSTCTFSPEEDELNALWFAKTFDLDIINIKKYPGMESGNIEWGNGNPLSENFLRMFPDNFNGEGHFISKFRKKSIENSKELAKISKSKINIDTSKLFSSFVEENLNITFENLYQHNDNLELPIIDIEQLKGVKVLRNGLRLGTFKKNRFEPNHSLILVLNHADLKNVIELTDEEYIKYRHGEAIRLIKDLSSAWVGVSYQNKIFSWGKYTNKTLKNFFPKGLRK